MGRFDPNPELRSGFMAGPVWVVSEKCVDGLEPNNFAIYARNRRSACVMSLAVRDVCAIDGFDFFVG
jgi:hypothetical protein